MTEHKKPGLAAGPRYVEHLRQELLDAMGDNELIAVALDVASKAITKRGHQESMANARSKKLAKSGKPKILKRIAELTAEGAGRKDITRTLGDEFGISEQYARRLAKK